MNTHTRTPLGGGYQNKKRRIRGSLMLDGIIGLAIIGLIYSTAVTKGFGVFKTSKYTAIMNVSDEMEKAAGMYLKKNGTLGTLPLSDGAIPTTEIGGTGTNPVNVAPAATIDQCFYAEGLLKAPVSINFGAANTSTGTTPVTWNPAAQQWTAASAPSLNLAGTARVETTLITAAAAGTDGTNFDLQGLGTSNLGATALNHTVMEIVLPNTPAAMAQELSLEIDGTAKSAADTVSADAKGKVEYNTPTGGLTTVYVYILDL